ncbi:hypothetical protein [Yersinia intermedia]|nr:hypothetical protein [Yersinia intermedia]UZM72850.1 hypothetical protein OP861_09515 [Yersinia intermedia]
MSVPLLQNSILVGKTQRRKQARRKPAHDAEIVADNLYWSDF